MSSRPEYLKNNFSKKNPHEPGGDFLFVLFGEISSVPLPLYHSLFSLSSFFCLPPMRKGQFYILTAVIVIISTLFTIKIASINDGNIIGGIFIGVLSFFVVFVVYHGFTPVKWIGLIGFALLAFGSLMAGLENEDFTFFLMALGYSFLAWQLVSVKSANAATPALVDEEPQEDTKEPQQQPGLETEKNVFAYPTLVKRIQALAIDSMFLLAFMITIMLLTEGSSNAVAIRVTVGLLVVFLYEPLLTVYAGTLGQRAIGIRVRRTDDPSKKINLLQSYARTLVKAMLGWLSFITIHFNEQHRAIHDFAGSSVMVNTRS
jgi:hypothetical protein